jgi:ribosomal protein S18 acetylase RimI-like enzyme
MREPPDLSVRQPQTRALSDLFHDEIVAAIEADLRGGYPPQGLSLSKSDGPDSIWRVTGLPDKYFNNVTYANWPRAEATDRVGALIAELDAHGVDYSWWIGPSSSPAELPELLEAYGMEYQEDFPGMAIDLQTLDSETSEISGLEISRVDDGDGLARLAHTFTVATSSDPAFEPGLLRLLTASGYEETDHWRHYAGTLDGKTVATASAFTGAGVAGIYLVATVPAERRRGIATTLVRHVLQEARAAGYTIGTLQSSEDGLGLYQRLGFREYCRFAFYVRHSPS